MINFLVIIAICTKSYIAYHYTILLFSLAMFTLVRLLFVEPGEFIGLQFAGMYDFYCL